jgi:hypothetical protein
LKSAVEQQAGIAPEKDLFMPHELTQILLTNLQKHTNPKTKTWWENYVKVGHFSPESLKNATKYFSREKQTYLRKMLKQTQGG